MSSKSQAWKRISVQRFGSFDAANDERSADSRVWELRATPLGDPDDRFAYKFRVRRRNDRSFDLIVWERRADNGKGKSDG